MVAQRLEAEDVLHALLAHLGFAGNLEEVHAHAGGVEPDGLFHRILDHAAVEPAR